MLIKFIKDIITPKKCYNCGQIGYFLCPQCLEKTKKHKSYCYLCKKESLNFKIHPTCHDDDFFLDNIIVLNHYSDKTIKKLIKNSKYYNKKDIIDDFSIYLGDLLLKNIEIEKTEDYLIIPRPMFFLKKIFRGYNQSEILAKNISKYTKINYENNLIKKIKYTKSQSKLHKSERLKNLEKSFSINKKVLEKINGKTIIIVDDVVSTGTTLNEIGKILKNNGIKKVIGLVIASD
ncbi:MAG: ComF family protein [Candidatus Gracilibacteria bacterium]|nr:ComF family protein [Candidatus Gracilibacteria bacterium]